MPQSLMLKHLFKEILIAELMVGFLLLICTCSAQSLETSQPQLVTAMVGDDVVLPCHLETPLDLDELVVEWGRPDLNPRFVHLWFEGREYNDDQNMAYKGRTSLFTDRLKDGDASLMIKAVKHSDNGRFRCYNAKKNKEYFIDLLVGSFSSVRISLAALDEGLNGVMLDCSSAGWYPEPEMFWLDGEINIMTAGPTEKTKGPDGLYRVSSRVTVEKKHNNNITCRLKQKDINQTTEKHIYVQDGFFVPRANCNVSVGFSVTLGLILLLGGAAVVWKWRQTKTSMKKLKYKVNEEKEKYVVKKKSNLEEELRRRKQDQTSIDQQIEALMKMSEELKEQEERLTDQRYGAEKIVEDNDRKLRAVNDEVENQRENKMEKRAQGYLKLKEIITESNERVNERKAGHQQVELMTVKLIERTSQEVNKLKERKQEIEDYVVEIEKQLKGMETEEEIN